MGHRARDVRDAVVKNPVHDIGRPIMRRRVRGLEAAPLIDRDIDHDGPASHVAEHRPRDDVRGRRTRNQDRTDHQIGIPQRAAQRRPIGVDHPRARLEMRGQSVQHGRAAVEDGDIRLQTDRHLRSVEADHPAPEDQHPPRGDPGHASEQHPPSAVRDLQCRRPGLHSQAPRDLTHRPQEGQSARRIGDGLVGDTDGTRGEQIPCLLGVRSQVQIREQDLPRTQPGPFLRLRLLHLDQ